MILIIIGVIVTIVSLGYGALVFVANSMSDSPGYQESFWPVGVGLAIAALCFIGHHYGW